MSDTNLRTSPPIKLAEGEGEAHAYVVYFEPGGSDTSCVVRYQFVFRGDDVSDTSALAFGPSFSSQRGGVVDE